MEDTPDEVIVATVGELTAWLNERADVLGVRPNSMTAEWVCVLNWQSLDDGSSFLTTITAVAQPSHATTGLLYEGLNWHLRDRESS